MIYALNNTDNDNYNMNNNTFTRIKTLLILKERTSCNV